MNNGLLKFAGFIAVLAVLYYTVPAIFDTYGKQAVENERLETERQTKEQLKNYYSKLTTNEYNLSVPENWEDVISNGKTMYATINNTRVWTECPHHVILKGNGVERYVTEAPRGELLVYRGEWYIANVSKDFTDKAHVVEHISSCIGVLGKDYQEKIEQEQKNRKSFEKQQ